MFWSTIWNSGAFAAAAIVLKDLLFLASNMSFFVFCYQLHVINVLFLHLGHDAVFQFVSSRFYSPYTASQPASSASPHSPAVSKSPAKAFRVAAQFNSNDHAVDVSITAAAVASLSPSSADADDALAAAAVESRASDTGEHCNPDGPDFSDSFQLRFVSEVPVSSSQPSSLHVSLAAAQDTSTSPVPPRSPASFFSNVRQTHASLHFCNNMVRCQVHARRLLHPGKALHLQAEFSEFQRSSEIMHRLRRQWRQRRRQRLSRLLGHCRRLNHPHASLIKRLMSMHFLRWKS
jgi:hypothetical protein